MKRFAVLLVAAATLVASACSDGDPGREWDDLSATSGTAIANATELVATDDYQLLLGDTTSGSCIQLVVRTVGTHCVERSGGVGSFSARVDDLRFVWMSVTAENVEAVADHFVVWSSADPAGRRVEPVIASGSAYIVWVMQSGEAPWGVQIIAAGGTLHSASSLVGLPGS